MSTVVNKIEQILTSEYSTANFVELMQEIFDSMKLVAPNNFKQEFSNFSTHIVGKAHVGNYTTPEGKKIAIFSVQLKKENYVESSRSTQRSYAKKLIEGGNCDAAIVAFYTEGEPKWRLSFVRLDYEMKIELGEPKTTENLTPAKRYSFLVGRDEPSHTAIDRFRQFIIDRNSNPSLDELEEAFSVEKVTKEFFDLYCEKFYQLQEYLESNEDFVEESTRCGFTSEQFAKKLLGQIVFLYFLQKKGWLGVNVWAPSITDKEYKNIYYTGGAQGRIIKEHLPKIYLEQPDGTYRLNSRALDTIPDDEEEVIANHMVRRKTWGDGSKKFLRTIFEHSKTHKGHFFENYLEPLFYDTLNRNRGSMGYCPALHARVPFLSGGLFEPLDSYDWKHNSFDIPDEIFSNKKDANDRSATGILDIFDRYNFTMSEDEPMEREVAIDPEMLGKIFENLLEVKDRKSKGAFYTPREIVHYMCQESLVNYLIRKTGLPEDALRDFILYGDFMKDEDTVKSKREGNGGMLISPEIFKIDENGQIVVNRLKDIDDALATVRVADPAVGSGAFPLGMVNEIVRARENITAYITIGMNANRKRLLYKNERSPYALKYNAIRNSIFAVDIEPSAVDITQLRLWLSLVIDDEITPDAANDLEGHKNPLPLPNLECNVLCGNSLVDEFMGIQLIKESDILGTMNEGVQMDFGHAGFETIVKQLLKVQDELFVCDEPHKKSELKEQVQSLKDMLISEQLDGCADKVKSKYDVAVRRSSKPFILWQLDFARVFRDNGGFDIVIGNPPYLKEIDYKEVFEPVQATRFGKKYSEGKMNFWYYFFHKGLDLLRSNGHITFIAPNYFVAGSGAMKLNSRVVNECSIRGYVDFNKTKVFESADVQCMILMVTPERIAGNSFNAYILKRKYQHHELGILMRNLGALPDVSKFAVGNQADIMSDDYKINFENVQYASILNKIEAHQTGEKLFKATQGIVENPSCLNKKNIATVGETGVDISGYYIGEEVFVISKGRIDSLGFNENEKKLLREYHEPNEVSRYVCSTDFQKYLLYISKETVRDISIYPNIEKHLAKYRPFMELRRETQKGSIQWFQLHWPRKEALFMGEKVVYPQMGARPTFAYSSTPFFTNMSANIVYTECDIDLKVLTALLNSEMTHFWLMHRAKNRGIGLDIAVSVVDKFPVTRQILGNMELKQLAHEAIECANSGEDYTAIDSKINDVVYRLYGITEEEQTEIQNYILERMKS